MHITSVGIQQLSYVLTGGILQYYREPLLRDPLEIPIGSPVIFGSIRYPRGLFWPIDFRDHREALDRLAVFADPLLTDPAGNFCRSLNRDEVPTVRRILRLEWFRCFPEADITHLVAHLMLPLVHSLGVPTGSCDGEDETHERVITFPTPLSEMTHTTEEERVSYIFSCEIREKLGVVADKFGVGCALVTSYLLGLDCADQFTHDHWEFLFRSPAPVDTDQEPWNALYSQTLVVAELTG